MNIVELKNGSKAVIREAIPDDALQLLDIQFSIAGENRYMVTQSNEFNLTTTEEKQRIQEDLNRPGNMLLVAEINDEIIGFVSIRNESKKRKAHVGALGIFIQKEWRETSVGSTLMDVILKWAKNNPLIEKVGLAVFSNNERAIHLYKKLGFVEEGRRIKELKFNKEEYIDEILMYKFV
ncbi:N-acetyltransferase family protein [Alteribacillus sp. JSM 102045]|uniref:GNAT family N-acetyltransferase n=1 Tax=Alteribacillus sp. JSM 102045 TaxID=1562101 RepID=UPI0035C057E1